MLSTQELEETITQLDSVEAVRIVMNGDRVSEVHVLAAPAKAPKQVVRDVQSLAMARYGTNIDRRVISVVQLAANAVEHRTLERHGDERRPAVERPAADVDGIIDD